MFFSSIIRATNNLIHSKDYADNYRLGNSFSRSRKLSFTNLIYFILNATHKSLSVNYAQLRSALLEVKPPSVSKQALSKARQGISEEAFSALFHLSVNEYYQNYNNFSLWNDFHVYAVDGSTMQIPESKENLKVFGSNPNKYGKDTPLASVSVLFDITNDIIVDVHLKTYRFNERVSAKEHMEHLPCFPNSIIIFDRGYPSEELFRFLQQRGIYFLMRLPKTFKKAIFDQTDTLFDYPSKSIDEKLLLRSIHFALEDGSLEHLVTNLMPDQMEEHKFCELYSLRWGIESKYRELKNRLEIENFNCIKPISIRQEFFAAIFISNLSAIIKKEGDNRIIKRSSDDNKHIYQSNRSYIINRIKILIIFMLRAELNTLNTIVLELINEASQVLSIIRPNRRFGRFRKNNRRRYYSHMKCCI